MSHIVNHSITQPFSVRSRTGLTYWTARMLQVHTLSWSISTHKAGTFVVLRPLRASQPAVSRSLDHLSMSRRGDCGHSPLHC